MYPTEDVHQHVTRVFSSVVIIVVNLLTMVTFSRVRALRSLSNKLVVCLASTDLMVGLITLISALAWVPGLGEFINFSPESCAVRLCWFHACCSASMVNISLIALERYLYIVRPYLHVRIVTPAVIRVCMGAVWLLGLTFGISPVFFARYKAELGCDFYLVLGSSYVVWASSTIFFSTSLLTLLFYSLIARLALKMRRAVGTFHHPTAATSDARLASLRMALTSVKAPVVVFGAFFLCWTPHMTVYIFHHLVRNLPQKTRGWFTTAGLFNSAMNFFVYLTLNSQFRSAVLGFFRMKACSDAVFTSEGSSSTSRRTTTTTTTTTRPLSVSTVTVTAVAASAVPAVAAAAQQSHGPGMRVLEKESSSAEGNRFSLATAYM
ncbi:histamine H2 receptor-like [Babylonia areolata]|uniref:histamine H2 receptor-like n=1 Tax=Babylonia areolata TaxID=304850 RepID=UPI003FD13086